MLLRKEINPELASSHRHAISGAVIALLLMLSSMPQAIAGDHSQQLSDHDHAETLDSIMPSSPTTADDHTGHGTVESDPHAHHRHMMKRKDYSRTEHDYDLPDVAVVDMNGKKSSLLAEIDCGKPVMVNFLFTTCTTICPVLAATFTQVQRELGDASDQVRLISVTIDPEYDTPERLRSYAQRYGAGPEWQFLTGSLDDIVAIQKAFDAYRGNKMNHEPLTFLRAADGGEWVRVNGIASGADIVSEYEQLVSESHQHP